MLEGFFLDLREPLLNFAKHHDPKNRLIGLGFVVAFHALLIWGLVVGLARKGIELLPPPIETKIIDEVETPKEEPPPPKPDFVPPPPPSFTPPQLNIAPPAQATTAITMKKPPAEVVRIPPKIDLKGSPRACREPEYPSVSARLNEEGTAAISLLIGVDGKVQQSKVDQSSGFPRLDDATVKAFSRCKFIIGTTNGVPEASWFSMRYKWVVPD
jgi:protein TonB